MSSFCPRCFSISSLFTVQSLSVLHSSLLLNLSAFWVSVNLRVSFLSIRPRFLALKVWLNGSFMQISSASKEQGTIWLLRRNENWELGFFPSLSARTEDNLQIFYLQACPDPGRACLRCKCTLFDTELNSLFHFFWTLVLYLTSRKTTTRVADGGQQRFCKF